MDDLSDGALVIRALGLEPHVEGGWYRVTWRAPTDGDERPAGSAIYYFLQSGERAARHRVDAAETWHHYRGSPVELVVHPGSEEEQRVVLGPRFEEGERPHFTVPSGAWQEAAPLPGPALLGCTLAPAFEWEGHELAVPPAPSAAPRAGGTSAALRAGGTSAAGHP